MALTAANLTAAIQLTLSAAQTGFASTTNGPNTVSFNLNSLSLTSWTESLLGQYTVANAATQTVNFYQYTDLTSVSVTAGHILCLVVTTSGGPITIKPGASAALTWFFAGTTPSVTLNAGGLFVWCDAVGATGQVVDNTHKNLDFTNNGGGPTTTLTVCAITGP